MSDNNTNNKIHIVGYDFSGDNKKVFLETNFNCMSCKNFDFCNDLSNCKFVDYIRQRCNFTSYKYEQNEAVLNISVANPYYKMLVLNTVARAQKLRMAKSKYNGK